MSTNIVAFGFNVTTPVAAPVPTTAGTSSGSMTINMSYSYKITYVSPFGETDGGPASAPILTATGSVILSGIATFNGIGVQARRIYRTAAGNGGVGPWLLLTTINDNLTSTYTDTASDMVLGAVIPLANTGSSVEVINGYVRENSPSIKTSAIVVPLGADLATAAPLPPAASVYLCPTAVAATGVRLPPLATSLLDLELTVKNTNGINTLNVYPASASDNINALAGGAPFVLAISSSARFHATANGANFTWQTL